MSALTQDPSAGVLSDPVAESLVVRVAMDNAELAFELEAYLLARSSLSGIEAAWPEREADLRWLERQREGGHCGESTSEAIQRGHINACIDRIKAALSPRTKGGEGRELVEAAKEVAAWANEDDAEAPPEFVTAVRRLRAAIASTEQG